MNCAFDKCTRSVARFGWCAAHWSQIDDGFIPEPLLVIPQCSFVGCERERRASGLCAAHYQQRRRGQSLRPLREATPPRGCDLDGCHRIHARDGWCAIHYRQVQSGEDPTPIGPTITACRFDGCGRPHYAKGWCQAHYAQRQRRGQLKPIRKRTRYANVTVTPDIVTEPCCDGMGEAIDDGLAIEVVCSPDGLWPQGIAVVPGEQTESCPWCHGTIRVCIDRRQWDIYRAAVLKSRSAVQRAAVRKSMAAKRRG